MRQVSLIAMATFLASGVILPLGGGDLWADSEDDIVYIEGWQDSPSPYVPADPPRDLDLGGQNPHDELVYHIEDSFCLSDLQAQICIPDAPRLDNDQGEPENPIDIVMLIQAQVERDTATMRVSPARVNWQPRAGEVLINMETIVFTEAATQYLTTTILGYQVTVETTPVWFEWNFGDGSAVLGTSDQGAPYPDHRVSHIYTQPGEYFISLRTTWSARFRVEGLSSWIPVRGQPITSDSVGPIRAETKTNRLVHLG